MVPYKSSKFAKFCRFSEFQNWISTKFAVRISFISKEIFFFRKKFVLSDSKTSGSRVRKVRTWPFYTPLRGCTPKYKFHPPVYSENSLKSSKRKQITSMYPPKSDNASSALTIIVQPFIQINLHLKCMWMSISTSKNYTLKMSDQH